MKFTLPWDREVRRTVRLAPHRFGQNGNLVIIESDEYRVEIHLSDDELQALVVHGGLRLDIETRLGRARALGVV